MRDDEFDYFPNDEDEDLDTSISVEEMKHLLDAAIERPDDEPGRAFYITPEDLVKMGYSMAEQVALANEGQLAWPKSINCAFAEVGWQSARH